MFFISSLEISAYSNESARSNFLLVNQNTEFKTALAKYAPFNESLFPFYAVNMARYITKAEKIVTFTEEANNLLLFCQKLSNVISSEKNDIWLLKNLIHMNPECMSKYQTIYTAVLTDIKKSFKDLQGKANQLQNSELQKVALLFIEKQQAVIPNIPKIPENPCILECLPDDPFPVVAFPKVNQLFTKSNVIVNYFSSLNGKNFQSYLLWIPLFQLIPDFTNTDIETMMTVLAYENINTEREIQNYEKIGQCMQNLREYIKLNESEKSNPIAFDVFLKKHKDKKWCLMECFGSVCNEDFKKI